MPPISEDPHRLSGLVESELSSEGTYVSRSLLGQLLGVDSIQMAIALQENGEELLAGEGRDLAGDLTLP